MLVSVDIQPALDQQTGIGRYVRCLAEGLGAARGRDEVRLFCFDFHRRGVPFETSGTTVKAVRWCPGRWAGKAWQTLGWPPYDRFAGPADLYHFTNFVRHPLRRGRSVVSIYDASFLRYPEAAEPANLAYLNRHVKDTVAAADAILTISEFSKREMVDQLAVDPASIHVVYPGLDHTRHRPSTEDVVLARSALRLTRPYLLMVSTVEPRKNMPFLVEVFDRLSNFDGDLVIAGMKGWHYEPILDAMRNARRADRIHYLDYVKEEHLPGLYAGAELFVFPSLYEGFGFPPLEAMTCGTPVVSSDGGSLGEALGDGAEVLSSFDTETWVDTIQALLADEPRRAALAEKGREQAARYTWADHVDKTWDVYRNVGVGVKIALDTRWIFEELSGVGQVTQQLVRELVQIDAVNDYLLLFNQEELRRRTAEATGFGNHDRFEAVTVPYGVFAPQSQWALPRLLRRHNIDVYHAPNYMIPYRAFPRGRPGRIRCVVTIHDVIPLLFPDHAPRSRKARLFPVYRRLMLETTRRADIITTVSEASRQDLMRCLEVPRERQDRVVVIHNGVDVPVDAPERRTGRPSQLLYVGRFDPYKNLPLLVQAFAGLRGKVFPELGLRVIGPPDARYPEARELARELKVYDAIDWSGYVSGEELARAYQEADLLVQPSRYEGFGLPVLEAMATGTPVVCSRGGALPEVAGDAALLVDAGDADGLAEAIQRVLSDEALRTRLRKAGLEQAGRFTWRRTAEETLAAYRSAWAGGQS